MIQYNQRTNRFQVSYQAPFGGLDSSAFPSFIDPSNFAEINQVISDSNQLTPVGWSPSIGQALDSTQGAFLGYVPVAESSFLGYIITTKSVIVLAADGFGGVSYTTVGPYSPALATYGHFSYQVLGGLVIWTTETWNEIWSYNTSTHAIARLTNYIGGGILGSIDNQLICLGGVSNLDGFVPYRISWSAPGQYGQFQPYDVGSNTGNYAAGFNDLPDTSDVLTGIITVGTVAYLSRSQGWTQMSPTGSGIEPFSFNHLWASQLGIGTVFPDSIAQYGSMGAFVSDSGIYTLGIGGLQEITGKAKKTIYDDIQNISNLAKHTKLPLGVVTACCVPYLVETPGVYYVLGVAISVTSATPGTAPSINQYNIYAIDTSTTNCYSLGTLDVSDNPLYPSLNAVGIMQFVNRSYSAAPSPAPPPPVTYPDWASVTFYTPFNAWSLFLPNSNPLHTAYVPGGLYELKTGGVINTALGAPPTVTPPAFGTDVIVGTATFTYLGPGGWTPNHGYQLNQMASHVTGIAPDQYTIAFKALNAGTSGSSTPAWNNAQGSTTIDGGITWVCIGPISTTLTSENTPGGANSYLVSPNLTILDPGNFLQNNVNVTVIIYTWTHGTGPFTIIQHDPMPGGFSQSTAPVWNDVNGATTTEVKTLATPVPAATWVCLGPKPSPIVTLVGANTASIVPLFVTINNGVFGGGAHLVAWKLRAGGKFDLGSVTFRKEQMEFGKLPTVSKIAFIAALTDPAQNGSISVSIDGGATYNAAFKDIIITAGTGMSGNGVYFTLFTDGVQTLQRPQLVIRLVNTQVVEAWYQGTLADEDLI